MPFATRSGMSSPSVAPPASSPSVATPYPVPESDYHAAACTVCGAEDPVIVARRAGDVRLRNVSCRRCGHVYVSPRPALAAFEQFLESDETSLPPPSVAGFGLHGSHPQSAAAYAASQLQLRAGERVLYVEDDGGATANCLRQWGAVVAGTSRRAARRARSHEIGVPSGRGPADIRFDGSSVIHCAIVTRALEEAHEPLDLLLALRRRLPPQGRVLIQVRNLEQPGGLLGDLFTATRLHCFDAGSLATLLRRAGLRPVRLVEDRLLTAVAEVDPFAGELPRPVPIPLRSGDEVAECLFSYEALESRRREIIEQGPSVESVTHVVQILARRNFFQHLTDTVAELCEHLIDHGALREAYAIAGAAAASPVPGPVRERLGKLAEAVGFAFERSQREALEEEAAIQRFVESASFGLAMGGRSMARA